MDSPSAPQAPDPKVTAEAQGTANKEAAYLNTSLNRADQYTPLGSLTWTQGDPVRTFNQQRYDDAVKASREYATQQSQSGQWVSDNTEAGGLIWKPNGGDPSQMVMPDRNSDQFYDMVESPRWSSKMTLDPRVQAILDASLSTSQGLNSAIQAQLGRVNDKFAQGIDYNSLPAAPQADEAARQRVEDALYGRMTRRMDERFGNQEEALRSRLINSGSTTGSEGWMDEMKLFNYGKNDAYQNAMDTAIQGGGAEMERYFNLGSRARQDALSEQTGERARLINELASLRNGSQVTMPQFSQTPSGSSINPAPFAQLAQNQYQGQLGQYNADVASQNQMVGTLASVASILPMFLALSDRRAKRNITRIGTHPLGIGWYSFQYLNSDDRHEGVMADEVLTVKPSAVHTRPDGLMMVNYGEL